MKKQEDMKASNHIDILFIHIEIYAIFIKSVIIKLEENLYQYR